METSELGTHQKALQINLDPTKYGAFAEIGAGQEVARWFFRVGGAAGTIAKTMSAYDMIVSDAIYGKSDRYVGRARLSTMLEHEYRLIVERLDEKRGAATCFFVFSDTVAAKAYSRNDESHGWLGVRFQTTPRGDASEIIIHVRLADKENIQQQEALGVIGVNLIYGALYLHEDPSALIDSLRDDLTIDRTEVDMAKFSGPAFENLDNRIIALQLVQKGLTRAAMFDAKGDVVQAAEMLYKKAIIVERGSFRPMTKTAVDMLNCATAQFVQEPKVQGEDVLVLTEMTLKNLTDGDTIDHADFLDRVDCLTALGKNVLISNYLEYHRLAQYLFVYTKKMIGIAMGVPSLREVFDEKYYTDLDGGILESLGRLFKNDLKLYVYPVQDKNTGALITAGNLRVAPHLKHLYAYLIENRLIEGLRDFDERCLPIFSRDVLARIRSGDATWKTMVPPQVEQLISERKLFGFAG